MVGEISSTTRNLRFMQRAQSNPDVKQTSSPSKTTSSHSTTPTSVTPEKSVHDSFTSQAREKEVEANSTAKAGSVWRKATREEKERLQPETQSPEVVDVEQFFFHPIPPARPGSTIIQESSSLSFPVLSHFSSDLSVSASGFSGRMSFGKALSKRQDNQDSDDEDEEMQSNDEEDAAYLSDTKKTKPSTKSKSKAKTFSGNQRLRPLESEGGTIRQQQSKKKLQKETTSTKTGSLPPVSSPPKGFMKPKGYEGSRKRTADEPHSRENSAGVTSRFSASAPSVAAHPAKNGVETSSTTAPVRMNSEDEVEDMIQRARAKRQKR